MNSEKLKAKFKEIEKESGETFEAVNDFIFRNPELSGEEYICSSYLIELMKNHDFTVTEKLCGLDTAFRADFIAGDGPVIAFLAEYDALPCISQDDYKMHKAEHTCGHNWIAAATAGVCICLSKMASELNGRIVLIGTPAEESYGAKVDLIKGSAFNDIDVVLQPHLESFTDYNCTSLALDALEFRFLGRATHSASYPHEGINALDAVNLMFNGVNAMRQQLKPDAKVCGVITRGGERPNITPDYASCRFYIRAKTRKYLDEVTQWVINCARGAELMTKAKVEYSYFENSCEDILNIDVLQEVLKRNLIENGITEFIDSEIAPTGSSDIGSVSKVCPTMYFEMDLEGDRTFYTHEESAVDLVNSDAAYRKLHQVINVLGGMAIELLGDPKLIKRIRLRHQELLNRE